MFDNASTRIPFTTKKSLATAVSKVVSETFGKAIKVSYKWLNKAMKKARLSVQHYFKYEQAGPSHVDCEPQFQFIGKIKEVVVDEISKTIDKSTKISSSEVITLSVDSKGKLPIGNFAPKGSCISKKKQPKKVADHDFYETLVAIFGVFDLAFNSLFLSLCTSHDTAQFAVDTIRDWWFKIGKERYPFAKKIIILCDGGGSRGSNSSRSRLWKKGLAEFCKETGLIVQVSHYPPGKSKYNPIEHRGFNVVHDATSVVTFDSPEMLRAILLKDVKTQTGLTCDVIINDKTYATGVKVSNEDFKNINVRYLHLKGAKDSKTSSKWNYIISPATTA